MLSHAERYAAALIALTLALSAVCTSAATFPAVALRNRRWVEAATGRERFWHGVNVVYKATPFHPQ